VCKPCNWVWCGVRCTGSLPPLFLLSIMKRSSPTFLRTKNGPRLEADEHRAKNLRLIYNSTDGECISMLRMGRVAFFSLCNLFRIEG